MYTFPKSIGAIWNTNSLNLGFELGSLCPFPTTITFTPLFITRIAFFAKYHCSSDIFVVYTIYSCLVFLCIQKLVDEFTYLGGSVSSTENDISLRLAKVWAAINRLSVIWRSDLSDKIKRNFFHVAVVSILLYGCTTWTLTKCTEKKLDGNCTRMLQAELNKSWKQHPTKQQLYGHLPLISKTIQVRRTRHAVHC